jgi:hypothetical protein
MTIWAEIASGVLTEEEGFRWASFHWFLLFYQRLRPDAVSELISRVRPLFYEGGEAFQKAVSDWIEEFGLPNTKEMKAEVVTTLFRPSPSGRPVFAIHSIREVLKVQRGRIPRSRHSSFHPFPFEAPGWIVAEESIDEAESRLRAYFEKLLAENTTAWRREQRSAADLVALWKQDRKHVFNLRLLAHRQAFPDLSERKLAQRFRCSLDTARRGLRSAADCLGLPRESIRHSRRGRKPRPL